MDMCQYDFQRLAPKKQSCDFSCNFHLSHFLKKPAERNVPTELFLKSSIAGLWRGQWEHLTNEGQSKMWILCVEASVHPLGQLYLCICQQTGKNRTTELPRWCWETEEFTIRLGPFCRVQQYGHRCLAQFWELQTSAAPSSTWLMLLRAVLSCCV